MPLRWFSRQNNPNLSGISAIIIIVFCLTTQVSANDKQTGTAEAGQAPATQTFHIDNVLIEVSFAPGIGGNNSRISAADMLTWVEKSGRAVAGFYHGFPVTR